jgi:hypothetical protein
MLQPVDPVVSRPRQLATINFIRREEVSRDSEEFGSSAIKALSERIAIWAPLAATAFGVRVMQVVRIVPTGTPLWPTYRRQTHRELNKSDGSSNCRGGAAAERCSEGLENDGSSDQAAVVSGTDSLKDGPFSKITHFDADGQIYTECLSRTELAWNVDRTAALARG